MLVTLAPSITYAKTNQNLNKIEEKTNIRDTELTQVKLSGWEYIMLSPSIILSYSENNGVMPNSGLRLTAGYTQLLQAISLGHEASVDIAYIRKNSNDNIPYIKSKYKYGLISKLIFTQEMPAALGGLFLV